MWKILIILPLFCGIAVAQKIGVVSTIYIVYADKIPTIAANAIANYGKKVIGDAEGQPYGLTVLEKTTTTYWFIGISSNTNTEAQALKSAEASGYIKKYMQRYTEYQSYNGKQVVRLHISTFCALPSELSKGISMGATK